MSFIIPETLNGITIALGTAKGGLDFSLKGGNLPFMRSYLKESFGADVVVLKQIHSSLISEVDKNTRDALFGREGDGLFTTDSGLILGILTADCYPVFLAGDKGICALHCGWRGVFLGIIGASSTFFNKIGDRPKYAYIGAGISAKNFAVGEDFIHSLSEGDRGCLIKSEDGNFYFDLLLKIRSELSAIGVKDIFSSNLCTYENSDFYSYRRDKTEKRMLSFILKGRSR
ncbi:MAG: polyphenol oxidase family protein [Deferribacteraceae bacterium]|jgi:YfiH family protein|nr:polyphenol oxidase family protein [Deferribacteraceae bacterium]